jgi:hypothetical protein
MLVSSNYTKTMVEVVVALLDLLGLLDLQVPLAQLVPLVLLDLQAQQDLLVPLA